MKKKLLFEILLFGLLANTYAKIPEPSVVISGELQIGNSTVTKEQTNVNIEAKLFNGLLASYSMGDIPEAGDRYVLVIPIEATVGDRTAGTARLNDLVEIYIQGNKVNSHRINDKGVHVSMNLLLSQSDSDNDGMPDDFEIRYGLNINDGSDAEADPDGDGLTNYEEFVAGTDPTISDTDQDGMSDGFEREYGLNPLDPEDAQLDNDSDGLTNLMEYKNQTDPTLEDTDQDGMDDLFEITYGLDPTDSIDAGFDRDGDGFTNLEEFQNNTNPNTDDAPSGIAMIYDFEFHGHNNGVSSLDVSASDRIISSGVSDPNIKIWSINNGVLIKEYESLSKNGINRIMHKNDMLYMAAGNATIEMWNMLNDQRVKIYQGAEGSITGVSTYGEKIYAGSTDGNIYVWDKATGVLNKSWEAHSGFIGDLYIVSEKIYSLETFPSKSVKLWSAENSDFLFTIGGSSECCNLASFVISDNKLVLSGSETSKSLNVINLNSFDVQILRGAAAQITSIAANTDYLVAGDIEGKLQLWNLKTGNLLDTKLTNNDSTAVRTLALVNNTLISGSDSGKVRIWEIRKIN